MDKPAGVFTGHRLSTVVITHSLKTQKSDFRSKTKRQGGALLKHYIITQKHQVICSNPQGPKISTFYPETFSNFLNQDFFDILGHIFLFVGLRYPSI